MAFWYVVITVTLVGQVSRKVLDRASRKSRTSLDTEGEEKSQREESQMYQRLSRFNDADYGISLMMDLGIPALLVRKRCEAMNGRRQNLRWVECSEQAEGSMDPSEIPMVRVVQAELKVEPDSCDQETRPLNFQPSDVPNLEELVTMTPKQREDIDCHGDLKRGVEQALLTKDTISVECASPIRIKDAGFGSRTSSLRSLPL
uniref:Uncharacterized protein n=1 Tax=Compsopogon caeruleus TaxID=31354 RepID=A0A7S1TJ59_9RHOD|mmetsp:Transcript_9753/g.19879  ORF Transcript_9753/g.19879 Transcript_9753/m.19879 type:complete len:202 (+) Transcript_9753:81-686(+)